MVNKRCFSLYDIEEALRRAGAERVHEKAVVSFEMELEETVKDLVNEAQFYANYAGRKNLITDSDIILAANNGNASKARATTQARPSRATTRLAKIRSRIRGPGVKAVIRGRQI